MYDFPSSTVDSINPFEFLNGTKKSWLEPNRNNKLLLLCLILKFEWFKKKTSHTPKFESIKHLFKKLIKLVKTRDTTNPLKKKSISVDKPQKKQLGNLKIILSINPKTYMYVNLKFTFFFNKKKLVST